MYKVQLILIYCVFVAVAFDLEFEPAPADERSTLIHYRSSDEGTSYHFRNKLDNILAAYKKPRTDDGHTLDCEIGTPPEKGSGKVCSVDTNGWGPCVSSNGYNYNSLNGGPCIFLKLSEISDWVPEYYNYSTIPENMPDYLKHHIRHLGPYSNKLNYVWITCEGENPFDVENIGPLLYYPTYGFGGQYFPVVNEDHYLSPLVALYIAKPTRAVLINVECKMWARNIHHDSTRNHGTVHFELLVDY